MPNQNRIRNCVFTWNNYPDDAEAQLKAIDYVSYGIFQPEVGESGTPHLQGYLEFSAKKGFNVVARLFPWHIEARRGSQQQAIDYCTKEDSRNGDKVEWGEKKSQGKRSDIASAYERVRQGKRERDIAEELPVVHAKYYRGIERYRALLDYDNTKEFRHLQVTVLWGQAGVGKTRQAIESSDDYYILNAPSNGTLWFDGYQGEKTLIIDDFYGWIKFHDLLRILDGYQYRLPIKGSFTYAKWDKVFITSNKNIYDWYPNVTNAEQLAALERRINEIKNL